MRSRTLLALSVLCIVPVVARAQIEDRGDFSYQLADPLNAEEAAFADYFAQSDVLDTLISDLNGEIRLQQDVTVTFRPGSADSVYYWRGEIFVTYGFIADLVRLFTQHGDFDTEQYWAEFESKIVPVVVETVLHEVGHALLDVNEIPKYAGENEEILADQLAFFVVSEFYDEPGAFVPVMDHYGYRSNETQPSAAATEHPSDLDRARNYMCWIYGHDPALLDEEWARQYLGERLDGCSNEYQEMVGRWDDRLAEFWSGSSQ